MHTNCLSTQYTWFVQMTSRTFQLSCQRNPHKNTHNSKLSRNPHKNAHKWVHNTIIRSNDIAHFSSYYAKGTLTRTHTIVNSQGTLIRMQTNCLSTQYTWFVQMTSRTFQLLCQRKLHKNTHNCKLSRNPHKNAHKWVHNTIIRSNDIAHFSSYYAKGTLTRTHTIVNSQGTLIRMHTNCLSTQYTNSFKWHRANSSYHAKGTLTRIHTIVSSQGTLTRMHTNEYTTL